MQVTGIGNYNFKDFQFITIRFGSPKQVIDTFDWNVNMGFVDFKTHLVNNAECKARYLRLNVNAEKPLSALLRLPRMLKKGFEIEEKELLFTVSFISSVVNLKSSKGIEDQYEFISSGGSKSYVAFETAGRATKEAEKYIERKLTVNGCT